MRLSIKNRNCDNCGAPIEIGKAKCPYCDTPYKSYNEITIGVVCKIVIDGEEIFGYVGNIETQYIKTPHRNCEGLVVSDCKPIRKITFIEA